MIPFPTSFKCISIVLMALLVVVGCSQPNPEEPDSVRRKSPIAIAKTLHQPTDTYVKIVYGQPHKRDRTIFGNVVPYDQVWRTGANEATEITRTKDIMFGGKTLDAGTYALFSIPHNDDHWTIILNDALGQWGAFDYEETNDVMRIQAPAMQQQKPTETFTIQFSDIEQNYTNIVMQWDTTMVKIPIEFIGGEES